ncbi:VOC family protein [Rubinisphaera margarita]|uniref:VOC family protein n=1 Tax=Rubinisphaera margarita TaxID=2909586 RepID=UPI001EE85FEC|nr:VOC family protein [Rubinisphaera margarita]MCG6155968.1 VOC family protein [Rubinisphaera margarita]
MNTTTSLDSVHHIAISVEDIAEAVNWYRETFRCDVVYQDDTWAMLQFANLQMALVVPGQHPPHIGFAIPDAEKFGELKPHRDGTRSVYTADPFGNVVEMMDDQSI